MIVWGLQLCSTSILFEVGVKPDIKGRQSLQITWYGWRTSQSSLHFPFGLVAGANGWKLNCLWCSGCLRIEWSSMVTWVHSSWPLNVAARQKQWSCLFVLRLHRYIGQCVLGLSGIRTESTFTEHGQSFQEPHFLKYCFSWGNWIAKGGVEVQNAYFERYRFSSIDIFMFILLMFMVMLHFLNGLPHKVM